MPPTDGRFSETMKPSREDGLVCNFTHLPLGFSASDKEMLKISIRGGHADPRTTHTHTKKKTRLRNGLSNVTGSLRRPPGLNGPDPNLIVPHWTQHVKGMH